MLKTELLDKRTLNSKTFKNSDGSFTLEVHTGHIHFKDKSTGRLEAIRNDVLETPIGWEMRKAGYEVKLPTKSNGVIGFFAGKDEIDFTPSKINGQRVQVVNGIKTDHHQITYPNIADGVDLVLSCGFNSFRKELIIKKMPIFTGDFLEIEFQTSIPVKSTLTNKAKIGDIYFRKAFAIDSAPLPQEIDIKLDFQSNKLIKRIPRSFLEKAVYPVRTDASYSGFASSGDGAITSGADSNFTTVRNGTALSVAEGETTRNTYQSASDATPHTHIIRRLYFPHDTSTIPSGAVVSSGFWKGFCAPTTGSVDDLSLSLGLIEGQQASLTSLVTGDWAPVDFDRLSTDKTIASIIAGGDQYYTWTLNAAGKGAIQMGSGAITSIIMTQDSDIDDVDIGSDGSPYEESYMTLRMSEYANTASDPYLSITYSVPVFIPRVAGIV